MHGQNIPFRIQLPSQPEEERVFHARRPHRKSRAGCAKCKQRRVKCDESKPICQRCQKLGLDCSYEPNQPSSSSRKKCVLSQIIEQAPLLNSPDATAYTLSVREISSQLDEVVERKPGAFGGGMSNLRALRHFQDAVTRTVCSNAGIDVMEGRMIRLAMETPYLMHSIIAAATTHLCHVFPDNSSYSMVEAHHWQKAIQQYSDEIKTPIGPANMDALFSSCLLMTVNSFTLREYNPRQSFVFSDNPEVALNWLFVQSGLRHLLGRAHPWLSQSMWWSMFMASRGEDDAIFEDSRPGREDLPPNLADICGIDEFTTTETNPYLWTLRMLTPLLSIQPSFKTFPRYTTFMGRLLPDYYERLIQKDPPALVLLSWWLALMYSVGLWWVDTRARSECAAICMYLENSDDPRILQSLEFPAQACGYLLQHVQYNLADVEPQSVPDLL